MACETALATRGVYLAGYNLAWLGLDSSEPDVPVCERAISYMIDLHWKDTASVANKTGVFASMVSVGVDKMAYREYVGEHGNTTMAEYIAAMRGRLRVISPTEVRDSFILFLAGKVQDPATSNEVLLTYRRLMLSVEVKFHLVESPRESQIRAIQCREETGIAYNGLYLTALQRMFQIFSFAGTGKSKSISAEELHHLWERSGIQISSGENATIQVSGPWLPGVFLTAIQ